MVASVRAAGPPGWREQAQKLLAAGTPKSRIADEVGVSLTTVHRYLNPDYGRRQRKASTQRQQERAASDPAFRERLRDLKRKNAKRSRIREEAREEAAETGEPVEQVYERWGVA